MKKVIFLAALALLLTGRLMAQSFTPHTLATEGAWCWFADPRATHYANATGTINMSYVGYIDVHGNIMATQVNHLTGEKSDVLVRSYFQPDDHNNPTFLVLPDERVLIIYSRHTDEAAFYYRVSRHAGDITQLGDEHRLATKNNTTYPSPFIMSDDPTHWYLCWRGIGWHPTIARLTMPDADDNVTFDWGPYQMVQSTGARPYAKYYSNGKDKIYLTYTTGHPDNENPNWVYFNVVNINHGQEPTLEDIKGTKLSTISAGTFAVNKTADYKTKYPLTVVDAPATGTRDWVWQIALNGDKPCIAMVKINSDKTKHEYYYARWTGSAWSLTDLADGGSWFHRSNTEKCYSAGAALDQQSPTTVYLSLPTEGQHGRIYEIWKYTLTDDGQISNKEQLTHDSEQNNIRPYCLPNSQGNSMRLVWMNGDYYYWIVCKNYPFGYPTRIMTDADVDALAPAPKEGWTLQRDIALTDPYPTGTLFTAGDITYGLDADAYPYITVGGTTYRSSSRLYTSDAWQTCPATTDGKSYAAKLTNLRLTLTYADGLLTVYRGRAIDQRIALPTLTRPEEAVDGVPTQQGIEESLTPVHAALQNGDFEATYAPLPWAGVSSDRAINVPEGWTATYRTCDINDLSCLAPADAYYGQFFASRPAPTDGGTHTLWVRQRWSASTLTMAQKVALPEGDYTLTALVYATEAGADNRALIRVDDRTAEPTQAGGWQTLTLPFTSDGLHPAHIALEARHKAGEFICGFDNFLITPATPTGITGGAGLRPAVTTYDLAGRSLASNHQRGIVISNGRKVIKK